MNASNEECSFEFEVEAWNVESYKRRELLLKELKSIPMTKVSAVCTAAADTGWELFVVTIISVIANILTIANILHKHLKKTEKSKENTLRNAPIAYVFIGNEKVILNDMSRNEIVTFLKRKIHD